MKDNKTAMLRLPAFLIDFALVMAAMAGLSLVAENFEVVPEAYAIELVTLVCIPLGFFFYWSFGINLGKRLFRLKMVNADSGQTPSFFQYFRRCILFSLLISLNVVFLIPLVVSKRNRGFQDMLANTLVIRTGKRSEESPK